MLQRHREAKVLGDSSYKPATQNVGTISLAGSNDELQSFIKVAQGTICGGMDRPLICSRNAEVSLTTPSVLSHRLRVAHRCSRQMAETVPLKPGVFLHPSWETSPPSAKHPLQQLNHLTAPPCLAPHPHPQLSLPVTRDRAYVLKPSAHFRHISKDIMPDVPIERNSSLM